MLEEVSSVTRKKSPNIVLRDTPIQQKSKVVLQNNLTLWNSTAHYLSDVANFMEFGNSYK